MSEEIYFTPEEVAKKLPMIKLRTVHYWLRTGKLKGEKYGRQWRISEKDFEEFRKKARR